MIGYSQGRSAFTQLALGAGWLATSVTPRQLNIAYAPARRMGCRGGGYLAKKGNIGADGPERPILIAFQVFLSAGETSSPAPGVGFSGPQRHAHVCNPRCRCGRTERHFSVGKQFKVN